MKIPLTDQIAEIERYRNGLQGFVDNGVEPKEGPPAAVRLDRAEAALLTLRTYEAFEDEIRSRKDRSMTDQYNDMGEVECPVCDGTGVVCENHRDRPWDGMSNHAEACGCGAGAPCIRCSPDPTRQMGTGKIPTPQPNVDEGDGK